MGSSSSIQGVGYNKELVEELRDGINDAARETAEVIVREINNGIVSPVSERWYSEVAIKAFEKFQAEVKAEEENVRAIFQNLADQVKAAGEAWAEKTEGEIPEIAPIDDISLDIDISSITAVDGNGNRYIADDLPIESYATSTRESIKTYVDFRESNVDASGAFLGVGQATAIADAADSINEVVDKIMSFLTEGEDSIVSEIYRYRREYEQTGSDNAARFASSAID